MRNTGKGFVNVSTTAGAVFDVPIAARGAAFGDLNNDGQIDVVVGVLNDAPVILRNDGTKNHWLGIQLVGSRSNRQGIGARVVVLSDSDRRQVFDVSTGGSYLSSNDPRLIVGLGTAGAKRVEIHWPDGQEQMIANPEIDRYMTIKEPEDKR